MKPLTPEQQTLASDPYYIAIARCTARRYRGQADPDELESTAMLALVFTASHFDPNHPRKACFRTYLIHNCRRRCWDAVTRSKRVRENESQTPNIYGVEPHDPLAQVDDRDEIGHAIANELNPITADVIRRLYAGDERRDLHALYGVSRARIHQRINSFRNNRMGVA